MDFDLNDDQATVLNAIAPLLNRHRRLPDPAPAVSYFYGNALEADLTEGGWFAADSDALGLFEAGLLVEEIARLPCALEAMVSLIIAPRIGLPPERRPYALMRKDRPGIPSRYLPMARTVIIDAGSHVEVLDLDGLDVPALDGFLAAPYGRLPEGAMDGAEPLGGIPAGRLRHLWRLGLAAEISGAAQAAVDLTVDHVKQREQFGQPIGAFQAVQHRLAECATLVEGIKLMTRRACWSDDPADVGLAAAFAQNALSQIIYDTQQFHGATGLTLEYQLHHWTFRLKALQGELGGATAQARAAADALWQGAA